MGPFDNVKNIMKMREEMNTYKSQLEEMRVKASSKKEFVKITLDGERSLKNIEFSDDAMKLSKEDLAKHIKDTMKAAAKELESIQKKNFKNSPIASMFQQFK
ncbi:MAG: YbaB/EbfC family nucleoid-associated protein [Brevinemataceae bacterium]